MIPFDLDREDLVFQFYSNLGFKMTLMLRLNCMNQDENRMIHLYEIKKNVFDCIIKIE